MADEKTSTTGIAAHGASRLPSVEIDSFNVELKDDEGFQLGRPGLQRSVTGDFVVFHRLRSREQARIERRRALKFLYNFLPLLDDAHDGIAGLAAGVSQNTIANASMPSAPSAAPAESIAENWNMRETGQQNDGSKAAGTLCRNAPPTSANCGRCSASRPP